MPAVSRPKRLRGDLVRLVHAGGGVRDFALGAARILARAVPFDGVCVLTLDPATGLPTREVVENGLPASTARRMAEIEVGGSDVNNFDALARSERRAATSFRPRRHLARQARRTVSPRTATTSPRRN